MDEERYRSSKVISGMEIGSALHKADVLPRECRRIVIDIKADEAVKIFYETYADPAVLEVVAGIAETLITGVEKTAALCGVSTVPEEEAPRP